MLLTKINATLRQCIHNPALAISVINGITGGTVQLSCSCMRGRYIPTSCEASKVEQDEERDVHDGWNRGDRGVWRS